MILKLGICIFPTNCDTAHVSRLYLGIIRVVVCATFLADRGADKCHGLSYILGKKLYDYIKLNRPCEHFLQELQESRQPFCRFRESTLYRGCEGLILANPCGCGGRTLYS
jgi:hypothetical protein